MIEHAVSLIAARAKGRGIQITLPTQKLTLSGHQNEFKQAVLNSLFNAMDSIERRKESDSGFQGRIIINVEESEEKKCVRIIDNGTGIGEDIIDRIFEPYFTTKFQSRGTGIGLYMSKIVIEHNMNGSLLARNLYDDSGNLEGAEFIFEFENNREGAIK